MLKTILALALVGLLALASGACNTIEGIGKDLEKGGEAIQKSAR